MTGRPQGPSAASYYYSIDVFPVLLIFSSCIEMNAVVVVVIVDVVCLFADCPTVVVVEIVAKTVLSFTG